MIGRRGGSSGGGSGSSGGDKLKKTPGTAAHAAGRNIAKNKARAEKAEQAYLDKQQKKRNG